MNDTPLLAVTTRKGAERSVRGRHRLDRLFVLFCVATASVSVVILLVLLLAILAQGATGLSWSFLSSAPSADASKAGIRPALLGTIWVCFACALVTLPIGVATAVFLEEFKPRNRVMRMFHGFVQLNITNLAGVPSVVYGIIGLTGFVAMFGLLGTPKEPALEFGVRWFDQFGAADSDGGLSFKVAVDGRDAAPTTIKPETIGTTREGREEVHLIGPWDPLPDDPRLRLSTMRRGSEARRVEIDGQYFDEFETLARSLLRIAVDKETAPVTKVTYGMQALDSTGESVGVKVVDADAVPEVTLREGTEPQRTRVGDAHYDEFRTADDQALRIAVGSDAAPATILEEGMTALTSSGVPVRIKLSTSRRKSKYRSRFDVTLRADPEGGRVDQPMWYHFHLPMGRGVLAGALTLMLVVLPIVIIASQEALRAVPDSLREASLGMGSTPWQTVRNVTLPASIPGIMTGSILAMSRAIGEAAPVLIICGIVYIASNPATLMDDFTVMPLQIFNWAARPQPEFHKVAASGIIVLLTVLLSFNAVAVLVRQKLQKPLS